MRFHAGLSALCAALCGAACLTATPALAHDHPGAGSRGTVIVAPPYAGPWGWGGTYGGWMGSWQPPYEISLPVPAPAVPPVAGQPPLDRDGWLRECRRRLGDNGVGGAVIGGVVGGVAGNVIAGPGDKALGTIAGAAVGAVAGAAIDKAEDAPRVRDRCEAMLDSPAAYGQAPYGYMLVPVIMVPVQGVQGQVPAGMAPHPRCKETVVTEEYVPALPRRSRHIPPRAHDKRVPMN